MPPDAMASRVNRVNRGSLARWINSVGIRVANPVSPVKLVSPDNQASKQMEIRLAVLALRVHLMEVRTAVQSVDRVVVLGRVGSARSIANGMVAIREVIGLRVAKR